jgi:hypothetical protein
LEAACQPGSSCQATGTQRDPSRVMLPATGGFAGGADTQAANDIRIAAASQRPIGREILQRRAFIGRRWCHRRASAQAAESAASIKFFE